MSDNVPLYVNLGISFLNLLGILWMALQHISCKSSCCQGKCCQLEEIIDFKDPNSVKTVNK